MGFKLPGKSMTSGTSAHSSALKMKEAENTASALKQLMTDAQKANIAAGRDANDYGDATTKSANDKKASKLTKHGTKTYKTAYTEDSEKASATRKKYKTQEEFNKAADDWWKSEAGQKKASAKGSKFAHRIIKKEEPSKTETKIEKVVAKGEEKKDKRMKRVHEVDENVSKKTAKITKREARKEFGRGSKEHLAAKKAHLEAKATDIQGGKGGKKRGLFRKLATKINLKKQKKTQTKIDALKEEDSPTKIYSKKGDKSKY